MKKYKSRRDHNHSRARSFAFIVALILIGLVSVALYTSSQPTTSHLPATLEFNPQPWMIFVPRQVEYVGYINYHEAFGVSGNSSLFGSKILLQLPQVNFTIYPQNVVYELDIELVPPQFNGTVSVISLTQQQSQSLSGDLMNVNVTRVHTPIEYDGYLIYALLMHKFGLDKLELAYLTVINGNIVLSYDQATGLKNVEVILDQVSSNSSSLFDDVNVRDAFFLTGSSQNTIGFFVGLFPTQFAGSSLIAKSVVYDGSALLVIRALLFPSSEVAMNNLSEAEQVYSGASCKTVDSWLSITNSYSISRLPTELSGI